MRLLRGGLVALALGGVAVASTPEPAAAHGVAGVQPSNYETRVLAVAPPTPGIEVEPIELGDRLELRNTTRVDVVVLGYDDEPYLRVGPRGVFENVRSPAVFLNRERRPTGRVPESARAGAPPEWRQISTGTTARWHDHRAHWMGDDEPPAVRRDPGAQQLVQRFAIDLRRAGETIVVRGDVRWVPGPSPWPWVGLALVLASGIVLAVRTRLAQPVVAGSLALLLVFGAVHVVGTWGATPVSGSTKLAASAYALGGLALGALALAWIVRRGLDTAAPGVLLAGLFLAIASGFADVTTLTRSQVPTTVPAGFARLEVAVALGVGVGLAVTGAMRLRRPSPPRPARVPTQPVAVGG